MTCQGDIHPPRVFGSARKRRRIPISEYPWTPDTRPATRDDRRMEFRPNHRVDPGATMERKQLEYFLAIAAHGSFTSAAGSLHVSQPSLSYAIRGLEKEDRKSTRLNSSHVK